MHYLRTLANLTTPPESPFFDPWLTELLTAILALAILAALIYFARPVIAGSSADFTILVDEDDITFKGAFPPHMQSTIINFLREDCQIPGSYRIRGHWQQGTLAVTVEGPAAKPLEQRIRNFLKLNLKPPRHQ